MGLDRAYLSVVLPDYSAPPPPQTTSISTPIPQFTAKMATPTATATATYTSPTSTSSPFQFTSPLSLPSSSASQTAHLSALQTSLKELQSTINDFLTQKMASDKDADAKHAKDEENYGEEVVEE
ncbi:hypothetical protein P153DRAFT_203543 [Dothidotthia symphoricarpi CBS 119687]|uniref:EKC/KEOPS complex subunit GON7 n=1 Tax=Dothidotthia symphoricarpi CBS 119687 TaxID=1392245 RepID=A0A6A6AHY2_9PLEO|nr:uncharacterized protein P153DRAFT_203543 [Dothidotthia symphoricarpi CBS 119687]KAF2130705.1 hypothetical protein P153DRAFT_203543 [Dothidotthia symphoricarpi CBS 119687]